jgi:predicted DNA binding protein
MELLDFNPYKLEYCRAREAQLDGKTWQYYVEFMLYERADETTADMLFQSGCLFQPPAIVKGRYELQTMLAPTPNNIQRLFRLLKQKGRDYKTMAIREVEPGPRMLFTVEESGILTPKQLEAIRIAFRRGFYNYPRKIRISDLAMEAGSARSTFQEHLRLAEIRLITHTFQTEDPSNSSGEQGDVGLEPQPGSKHTARGSKRSEPR